jgi:hypothetical protein
MGNAEKGGLLSNDLYTVPKIVPLAKFVFILIWVFGVGTQCVSRGQVPSGFVPRQGWSFMPPGHETSSYQSGNHVAGLTAVDHVRVVLTCHRFASAVLTNNPIQGQKKENNIATVVVMLVIFRSITAFIYLQLRSKRFNSI